MRTTIKMIAERAGVSIGTVDRVLHDPVSYTHLTLPTTRFV